MRLVVNRLAPFFIVFLVFSPFLLMDRIDVMIGINGYRTVFGDFFFVRISSFGNALTVIFAFLLVLRFKLRWVAIFLLAFLFQVFIVVLFKKGIMHDALRPYLYFKNADILDSISLIEGVKMRYVNTFPSGHTATIFFLVSFFALLARNRNASIVLVIVGVLVGFSRIYLFQHWFIDVYFGMIFGTLSSVASYFIVKANPKKWHSQEIQVNYRNVLRNTQNVFRQFFNY